MLDYFISGMTRENKFLCAAFLLEGVIVALIVRDAFVSRDSVRDCFVTVKRLIDEERWPEAYAMTSPNYRAQYTLQQFIDYEQWRGPVRNTNCKITSLIGDGSVTSDDPGRIAKWKMGFERHRFRWYYRGNRYAFVDFL